jgi:hypothetical protein
MLLSMDEILPGLYHWTARHPRIHQRVSSYYLPAPGVLIDPLAPEDVDLDWFAEHGPPRAALLTNRHHYRDAGRFAAAFGCEVRAHRAGLHEFRSGERVAPFVPGDELEGGIVVHEVGAICPDEAALEILSVRAMSFADGVVRTRGGRLGFVPDGLLGDDPEGVRAGLRAAFARLLDEAEFDHVLLAHGGPVLDGRAALGELARGG